MQTFDKLMVEASDDLIKSFQFFVAIYLKSTYIFTVQPLLSSSQCQTPVLFYFAYFNKKKSERVIKRH